MPQHLRSYRHIFNAFLRHNLCFPEAIYKLIFLHCILKILFLNSLYALTSHGMSTFYRKETISFQAGYHNVECLDHFLSCYFFSCIQHSCTWQCLHLFSYSQLGTSMSLGLWSSPETSWVLCLFRLRPCSRGTVGGFSHGSAGDGYVQVWEVSSIVIPGTSLMIKNMLVEYRQLQREDRQHIHLKIV